jgi:hypothetical protein
MPNTTHGEQRVFNLALRTAQSAARGKITRLAGECNISPITIFYPSSNNTPMITLTAPEKDLPTIHHTSWLHLHPDIKERDDLMVVMRKSHNEIHKKSRRCEECRRAERMDKVFERAMKDTETWKRWWKKKRGRKLEAKEEIMTRKNWFESEGLVVPRYGSEIGGVCERGGGGDGFEFWS